MADLFSLDTVEGPLWALLTLLIQDIVTEILLNLWLVTVFLCALLCASVCALCESVAVVVKAEPGCHHDLVTMWDHD